MEKLTENLGTDTYRDSVSPAVGASMAQSLLDAVASIATAQSLARRNPLKFDEDKYLQKEKLDFETILEDRNINSALLAQLRLVNVCTFSSNAQLSSSGIV